MLDVPGGKSGEDGEVTQEQNDGLSKSRPILFSGAMVRAILDGRKTQTRRLLTPQPDHLQRHEWRRKLVYEGEHRLWCWKQHTFENLWDKGISESERAMLAALNPYGGVSDRLWVRETWGVGTRPCPERGRYDGIEYRADDDPFLPLREFPEQNIADIPRGWRPSIFMPRWASRITLEISEVRVQLLQEISDDDARAEGVELYTTPNGHISPEQRVPGPGFDRCRLGDQPHRLPFADLWDRINGKYAAWASNPWVWAISFRRVLP